MIILKSRINLTNLRPDLKPDQESEVKFHPEFTILLLTVNIYWSLIIKNISFSNIFKEYLKYK